MAAKNNKYLTFLLSNEQYAIPILKTKEIIGMESITRVPHIPDFIKGVLNLRGKIIPIIDLRLKFGLKEGKYDERTSIIIIELDTENGLKTSGMIVDSVQEVLDINDENIESPPKYGSEIDTSFLAGIGKVNDKVILLLEVDKILSFEDKQKIGKL